MKNIDCNLKENQRTTLLGKDVEFIDRFIVTIRFIYFFVSLTLELDTQ